VRIGAGGASERFRTPTTGAGESPGGRWSNSLAKRRVRWVRDRPVGSAADGRPLLDIARARHGKDRPMLQRLALIPLAVLCLLTPLMIAALATNAGADAPMNDTSNAETTEQAAPTGAAVVKVFTHSGDFVGPYAMPRVELTDDEWRERLTDEQFRILRKSGTEAAFCGTLLDNRKEGVYACAGCKLPLFSSDAKFKSGTGWPSFYQPVAEENIVRKVDRSHGMVRTEIVCARCDGHLGHVFPDGPKPTGERHCLNSESLVFAESGDVGDAFGELKQTVLAGGCFWCVEAVFEELGGVHDVVSGYAGGDGPAEYKAVVTGTTGHAEAVQITYDPSVINYEDLLRVHFATHDPTTLNRQGADIGTQYRSTLFYADEQERQIAEAFIADLEEQNVYDDPIVTTLEPLDKFYEAEAYHQDYVCNNPNAGYVRAVALPKVEKVRKKFADKVKETSPTESR
jgi:peptide methionine sulfoxide reductase msrA/msrB